MIAALLLSGIIATQALTNCVVVSDVKAYTCGSSPFSCLSADGRCIYSTYLTSRTGFGESHDITSLMVIPVDRPESRSETLICSKGERICGTEVKAQLNQSIYMFNGMLRMTLSVNHELLYYRDWDPRCGKLAGEGAIMCRLPGSAETVRLSAAMVDRYLREKGCAGFDVYKEAADSLIFQSTPQWKDGAFYGLLTSSCSQPVLFRCADVVTFEFVGIVPEICAYECQLLFLNGCFYAVMRGAKNDNFFVSKDGGKTFHPAGRLPDGLQRQRLMAFRGKVLIGYSAPDEKPCHVRNGRNNFHLLMGEGEDLSRYREVFHALDPMGLVYYDLVDVSGCLYVLWSNAARFPDKLIWGAVQGKDQILFSKLGTLGF